MVWKLRLLLTIAPCNKKLNKKINHLTCHLLHIGIKHLTSFLNQKKLHVLVELCCCRLLQLLRELCTAPNHLFYVFSFPANWFLRCWGNVGVWRNERGKSWGEREMGGREGWHQSSGQNRWWKLVGALASLSEQESVQNYIVVGRHTRTRTHTLTHTHATRTFVHANSDIMHGCPLRFIIKALSGCTGCEGVNMNRIKQIVWCVKDRHSSSKVLKLSLPMDWQGMSGRSQRTGGLLFPPLFFPPARHEEFPESCVIVCARSRCQRLECQLNK